MLHDGRTVDFQNRMIKILYNNSIASTETDQESDIYWRSDPKHFHEQANCPDQFPFLVHLTPGLLASMENNLPFDLKHRFWLGWHTDANNGVKPIWKSDQVPGLHEKDFENLDFPKIDVKNGQKECLIGFIQDGELELTTKNCRRKARWICTKKFFPTM